MKGKKDSMQEQVIIEMDLIASRITYDEDMLEKETSIYLVTIRHECDNGQVSWSEELDKKLLLIEKN